MWLSRELPASISVVACALVVWSCGNGTATGGKEDAGAKAECVKGAVKCGDQGGLVSCKDGEWGAEAACQANYQCNDATGTAVCEVLGGCFYHCSEGLLSGRSCEVSLFKKKCEDLDVSGLCQAVTPTKTFAPACHCPDWDGPQGNGCAPNWWKNAGACRVKCSDGSVRCKSGDSSPTDSFDCSDFADATCPDGKVTQSEFLKGCVCTDTTSQCTI